jgi:hypothetical protein
MSEDAKNLERTVASLASEPLAECFQIGFPFRDQRNSSGQE